MSGAIATLAGSSLAVVLAPLVAGLLALPTRRATTAWALGLIGISAAFAIAAFRLMAAPPALDTLGAAFCTGLALLATVAAPPGRASGRASGRPAGYGLASIATALAAALVSVDDAFVLSILVGGVFAVQAALLSTTFDLDRRSAPTAMALLIVGLCATVAAMLGAALMQSDSGVFDIAASGERLRDTPAGPAAGLTLLIVSLAAAAGLAPTNAASADTGARVGVEAAPLQIVIVRLAASVALVRVYAATLPAPPAADFAFALVVALIGVCSIGFGAAQAVATTDLRRLASHVLTLQLGGALLALAALGPEGFAVGMLIAAQGALIAFILAVGAGEGGATSRLDGLGKHAPFVALAMAAGALALSGAPMTAAFLGRWVAIEAVVARGWYWAAALLLAGAFVAVFVTGQLVERMYFRAPGLQALGIARYAAAPALGVAAALLLTLGLDSNAIFGPLAAAGRALWATP